MSSPTEASGGLPEKPRLSRLFRMQYEEVQKAWVLLYPEGMVQLNDSSAEILKLCTGEMDVAGIIATLEAKFSAPGIGPQIRDLLQEGVRRGWLQ
ncbi:MAG: hypothetical protein RL459_1740 [Pseudomonadota bacterium]|jgi:pyrroloquinoline quinone biosynthesis protein D